MATDSKSISNPQRESYWVSGEFSQRSAAVLMLCLQVAVLGFLSQTLIFPAIIASLAIVLLLVPQRIDLSSRKRFWLTSAIIIAFIVKFLVAPVSISFGRYFIRSQFAHAFAQGLMVLQILHLLTHRNRSRLPFSFAGIGMLSLFFACDIKVNSQERFVTQVLILCYLFTVIWFFTANRRTAAQSAEPQSLMSLRIFQGVILLVILGFSLQSSALLFKHERTLESWVLKLLNMNSEGGVGFSGSAELGSVASTKGKAARKIALRVEAERNPGYLRGRAFESYRGTEWVTRRLQRSASPTLAPVPSMRAQQPQERVFSLIPEGALAARSRPTGSTIRVYPQLDRSNTVFTKLGTSHVTIGVNQLAFNIQGVPLTSDQLMSPYSAFVPDGITQAHPDMNNPLTNRAPYLEVPRTLDPRIKEEIVKPLIPEGLTTAQKILRVERYFQETYKYKLGIDIPADQEPLNYFLLEKPAAHCEYFASGAAVMLRMVDVPTRYVTGFLAVEQNPYTKQWIARNEHAHAWVEAWDEERGWVTVEATPADGQPDEGDPSAVRQYFESIRARFATWREQFHQNGLIATIGIILLALLFPWGVMIGVIIGFVWLWKHRHQFQRKKPTWRTPSIAQLQKLLDQMLKGLRSEKWEPASGETLHAFARRLKEASVHRSRCGAAAVWIEEYATVRYQSETTIADYHRLSESLAEWKNTHG